MVAAAPRLPIDELVYEREHMPSTMLSFRSWRSFSSSSSSAPSSSMQSRRRDAPPLEEGTRRSIEIATAAASHSSRKCQQPHAGNQGLSKRADGLLRHARSGTRALDLPRANESETAAEKIKFTLQIRLLYTY